MQAAGNPGKPGREKKGGKASGATNSTPTQATQGGKASGTTNPTPTQANQGAPVQIMESPLESWVFSTASSYHVTAQREIMENYTAGNFGKVYLATGSSMDVVGKGDVRIKLSSNATWILRDVKHIPGYAWNQISVGLLDREGYTMIMSYGVWKVSKGDFAFTVPPEIDPPIRISYLS